MPASLWNPTAVSASLRRRGARRGRRVEDEAIHHERWLVSYADFLTLLLAFFVVMYSISQVNESKYRVLSDTLTSAFSTEVKKLPDAAQAAAAAAAQPVSAPIDLRPVSASPLLAMPEEFLGMLEQLHLGMGDLENSDMLAVSGNERWLKIELNASLLFDPASAEPKAAALPILRNLAATLGSGNQPVKVEGYTDSLPINSARFPSNWELSSARASAVVRALIESGVAPSRLSAVGFADQQPVADNMRPEGRAANRRVVLMIAREVPKVELEPIALDSLDRACSGEILAQADRPAAGAAARPARKPIKLEVWLDQQLKGIVAKPPKRSGVKVPLKPVRKKRPSAAQAAAGERQAPGARSSTNPR